MSSICNIAASELHHIGDGSPCHPCHPAGITRLVISPSSSQYLLRYLSPAIDGDSESHQAHTDSEVTRTNCRHDTRSEACSAAAQRQHQV
jgi:hypothetical protein